VAAAPCATWIASSNASRSKPAASSATRFAVTVNAAASAASTAPMAKASPEVRYRAWQPPECLHPSIGSHAPLTFDLTTPGPNAASAGVPTTSRIRAASAPARSRSMPYEAESRRLARFLVQGATQGRFIPPAEEETRLPITLDFKKCERRAGMIQGPGIAKSNRFLQGGKHCHRAILAKNRVLVCSVGEHSLICGKSDE